MSHKAQQSSARTAASAGIVPTRAQPRPSTKRAAAKAEGAAYTGFRGHLLQDLDAGLTAWFACRVDARWAVRRAFNHG